MPSRGYVMDPAFESEVYAARAGRPTRRSFWSGLVNWHLREWLLVLGAGFAVGMIVINALFLQAGPHPAPMFANRAPASVPRSPMMLPRPRPTAPEASTSGVPMRTRSEVVADIQRELAQRGFYDGPKDGIYNARTDSAIRDFEQAARLRPSAEPNEALLSTIVRSTMKAPPAAPANDPIAGLLAPSRRIIAIQRALAAFGYGQIQATGAYDPETKSAIEAFERNRKLPVTGQISDRLAHELAVVTGRPLE